MDDEDYERIKKELEEMKKERAEEHQELIDAFEIIASKSEERLEERYMEIVDYYDTRNKETFQSFTNFQSEIMMHVRKMERKLDAILIKKGETKWK